jgi:hypothetical protein
MHIQMVKNSCGISVKLSYSGTILLKISDKGDVILALNCVPKDYGGTAPPFLTSALDGGERSTPLPLHPHGAKNTASELYRQSDRSLSAKLVPTFTDSVPRGQRDGSQR